MRPRIRRFGLGGKKHLAFLASFVLKKIDLGFSYFNTQVKLPYSIYGVQTNYERAKPFLT